MFQRHLLPITGCAAAAALLLGLCFLYGDPALIRTLTAASSAEPNVP